MRIIGLEGIDGEDLSTELRNGARFVIFEYCISLLLITFKRPSNIHFVRSGESAVVKGLGFTMISLFLGWWGIPWGPIYTIGSFINNFRGGRDVTPDVVASLQRSGI